MGRNVVAVAGTRPEIIKMAPVIRAFKRRRDTTLRFVLSGQHYDYEMSRSFVDELELPQPDEDMRVGAGSHAEQTARMLVAYEKMIKRFEPQVVLAEGDTNTVAALGLAAAKLGVAFGHIEAGLRNYDKTMPEEINRLVAAVTAELHFAPTYRAALNLLHEGILPTKVYVTGNTIVDSCQQNLKIARKRSRPSIVDETGAGDPIITVTIHRAENVDKPSRLRQIIGALLELDSARLVFPVHPRTKRRLKQCRLWRSLLDAKHITLREPLGYLDFLLLLSESRAVLTDSGGVQEEALTLRVPCVTVRSSTERPETVETGANVLAGTDRRSIVTLAERVLYDDKFAESMKCATNPLGDGKAGQRIAEIVQERCEKGLCAEPSKYLSTGSGDFVLKTAERQIAGMKVKEFHKKYSCHLISLIYDEAGAPIFPHPELVIRKGWKMRLFRIAS